MFVRRYDEEAFFIALEGGTVRGPITAHPRVHEAER